MLHAELFVERDGVFVRDEVDCDVPLPARDLVRGLHEAASDALPLIIPVDPEIGDKEPIGEVRHPEQDADEQAVLIPRGEADRRAPEKRRDPYLEPFAGILRAEIGAAQEIDILLRAQPFALNLDHGDLLCSSEFLLSL